VGCSSRIGARSTNPVTERLPCLKPERNFLHDCGAITLSNARAWISDTLHYEFGSDAYLTQALTHRSASSSNNERLEFLGDAVLDTVISEIIFRNRPEGTEGELSRLRSALVKDTSLAELAAQLGLGEHIILGPGEKKAGGHRRASILADALEALFGAVYLDAGYEAAARVICTAFGDRLENLPDSADLRDSKTRLQEYLQSKQLGLPTYEITDTRGKAHKQSFTVACRIAALEQQTSGVGGSRREAEQHAAENMLHVLDRSG
jgi:ribonuclease III